MKTKARSVQVFELRLWSRKHYNLKTKTSDNIYDGSITECKSKKVMWFPSAGKLLEAIEKLYKYAEKR